MRETMCTFFKLYFYNETVKWDLKSKIYKMFEGFLELSKVYTCQKIHNLAQVYN